MHAPNVRLIALRIVFGAIARVFFCPRPFFAQFGCEAQSPQIYRRKVPTNRRTFPTSAQTNMTAGVFLRAQGIFSHQQPKTRVFWPTPQFLDPRKVQVYRGYVFGAPTEARDYVQPVLSGDLSLRAFSHGLRVFRRLLQMWCCVGHPVTLTLQVWNPSLGCNFSQPR